jgi:glycosyltransferase involved in cell wall biosynthesis
LIGLLDRFYPISQTKITPLPRLPLPVSIVIPVFNRERYLERAIRSAMAQSLDPIEIVIIDDCSTDNSSAIIHELKADDPRLRLYRHNENAGTHAARTTGVRKARGAYILSLDPDDRLLPFIAEDAVHQALLHSADIVEFQVLEVLNGSVHLFSFLSPPLQTCDGLTLADLFANHHLNWNLWKRLIRREVYTKALLLLPQNARSKRVIYAEDKLHFGLVVLCSEKFYFLKEVGYVYFRDNPDNSESGKQQTQRAALRQLRYVEKGLYYLYKKHANISYVRFTGVPAGLGSILKRRRRRRA